MTKMVKIDRRTAMKPYDEGEYSDGDPVDILNLHGTDGLALRMIFEGDTEKYCMVRDACLLTGLPYDAIRQMLNVHRPPFVVKIGSTNYVRCTDLIRYIRWRYRTKQGMRGPHRYVSTVESLIESR